LVDLNGRGIGIIEMLFSTNILAIVGGGDNPRYPENQVFNGTLFLTYCYVPHSPPLGHDFR